MNFLSRSGRAFAMLSLLSAAALFASGCGVSLLPDSRPLGPRTQRTVRAADAYFAPKVVVVDVFGSIGLEGSSDLLGLSFSQGATSKIAEELASARRDPEIKAMILRINSPGGLVTASDVIYDEIKRYKEETGVKVYAMMIDVAASGGYYAAMGADEISALPTTITGSIGVIASFPLVEKLAESVGYEQRTFVTGANKDLGSLFKDFTPEQRELVQATIDEMFERFLDVVQAGRPKLSRERVRQLADGRVYTGPRAKKLGLVDHVEYVPDLIKRIEKDLGSSVELVTYGNALGNGSSLYRAGGPAEGFRANSGVSIPSQINVSLGVKGFEPLPAGFYYLWQAP